MDLKQYGFKSMFWVYWTEALSASGRALGGFLLVRLAVCQRMQDQFHRLVLVLVARKSRRWRDGG
jgi:hypothetical protein